MPNSYDFLAPPKPHQHVSRLIVLLVILGLILILGWLYAMLWSPTSTHLAVPNNTLTSVTAPNIDKLISEINQPSTDSTLIKHQTASFLQKQIDKPASSKTTIQPPSYNDLVQQINIPAN